MLLLVLLCGACAFLVRANTTDAQLGVLGPSTGPARDDLLLGILRKIEKMEEDRAQDRAQDKRELLQAIDKTEKDRAQDKLDRAQDKKELLQAIGKISDAVVEISDAVVTAATSDRVYACARGARSAAAYEMG